MTKYYGVHGSCVSGSGKGSSFNAAFPQLADDRANCVVAGKDSCILGCSHQCPHSNGRGGTLASTHLLAISSLKK